MLVWTSTSQEETGQVGSIAYLGWLAQLADVHWSSFHCLARSAGDGCHSLATAVAALSWAMGLRRPSIIRVPGVALGLVV
jgi:hypothetical protein